MQHVHYSPDTRLSHLPGHVSSGKPHEKRLHLSIPRRTTSITSVSLTHSSHLAPLVPLHSPHPIPRIPPLHLPPPPGKGDTHPSPVTGSHPSLASNPSVAHPGFRPCRMSLRTPGLAYKTGLTKPTGDFPACRRFSFMRVSMEAKTGVDAMSVRTWRLGLEVSREPRREGRGDVHDVPYESVNFPLTAVT